MLFSSAVFDNLVKSGELIPKPDILPPSVPMDYDWARVKTSEIVIYYKKNFGC